MSNTSPIGVVLAGGKSSRMGRDKALCEINGVRLIDRVLARLRPQVGRILLSGPSDYGLRIEAIADEADGPLGPCAGLFAAARRLAGEAEGFLTVPVDAPFLPEDLAPRLLGPSSAVACAGGAIQPAFAWWRFDEIEQARRSLRHQSGPSLKALAETANARLVLWPDEAPFMNVNDPNDLRAACARDLAERNEGA